MFSPGYAAAALFGLITMMAQVAWAAAEPKIAARAVIDDRYPSHPVAFPEGVTGFPDLTYATLSGYRPLTLDLYLPAESMPAPAAGFPLVVYIHGGGWTAGHSRHAGAFADFPKVLAALAARGYVVASVNYRLSGEARSPGAVLDIKTAIRWLRSKAADYRIDPARAAAWGGSAGAQLAGLAAVSCGVEAFDPDLPAPAGTVDGEGRPVLGTLPADLIRQSDCIQGAVAWYGVFDFTTLREQAGAKGIAPPPGIQAAIPYLGCDPASCPPGLAAGASSLPYIDPTDPPMLLIHGTADRIVPSSQSQQMAAALEQAGVPVELRLLKAIDHGLVGRSQAQTREASLSALRATFDFFDTTLKSAKLKASADPAKMGQTDPSANEQP